MSGDEPAGDDDAATAGDDDVATAGDEPAGDDDAATAGDEPAGDDDVATARDAVSARVALAVVALGGLAAATLVARPAGLGVTIVAWAVLAIAVRPRGGWSIAWWLAAAALAAVPTLRAAGWIVWPSMVAAAALGSLAAAGGGAWWPVAAGIARAARLDRGLELVARGAPQRSWRPPLAGAGISVGLLAVFVPLFATADAAFAHLLGELIPDHELHPAARVATWLGVIGVGGGLLWAGRAPAVEPAPPARTKLGRTESTVPLVALVVLFAAFVALQLTTLYGGHDYVLRTAGLTYAEYAREGFAQLLAVAALTLAVIAASARWGRASRVLLGALCVLTLVVLASALKRLDLYMDAYGFTRLRLSAHATILWLGAILALVLLAGAIRRTRWLPRASVALTAAAVLAFALSNPDRRIAEHNVQTGRLDERVLRGLSADAAPALPCRLRQELGEPDGIAGLNLGRAQARDALAAAVPEPARGRGATLDPWRSTRRRSSARSRSRPRRSRTRTTTACSRPTPTGCSSGCR